MALKKSTRKRSRIVVEESSKERRMKHQEDVSTRTAQLVEEQAPSPSSSRQIISMAMCPIMSDRRIIFSFLKDLGLQVGDLIEEQGWSNFCSLNISTYPNIVKIFYENLILGEEHIESKVKGKRIIVLKKYWKVC